MGLFSKKQIYSIIYPIIAFIPLISHQVYPTLQKSADLVLQQGLESFIERQGLEKAVQSKSLCITLVDITERTTPRLASVNGNVMMYAASLPKIAILLGAFERSARGELIIDQETREMLIRMIRNSSNTAATEVLNKIGKAFLASVLQSPQYRFYDPEKNGGLWVGKEYGKAMIWKRDPLHNISHGATAMQVARYYYLLETGRLVSPEISKEMKMILGKPAVHHKFVKGLEETQPDSKIFRKSGTWKHYHSDSAIIERDGRRYIAVALANLPDGGDLLRRLIVGLDDLIFQHGLSRSAI